MRFANSARAAVAAVALVLTAGRVHADCADGAWFCDDKQPSEQPPAGTSHPPPAEGGSSAADPDESASPSSSPPVSAGERPPVVYPGSRHTEYPTQRKHKRRAREFGMGAHAILAALGNSPHMDDDAAMGGLGLTFRFRPLPLIALDASLELVGGSDWNGDARLETALLANAVLFFNPRDRFQVYTLGGFGFSAANVSEEVSPGDERDRRYSYAGLQWGLGAEGRVTKKTAIGLDFLVFLRARSDDGYRSRPEFVDPVSHRATNVSGGGLIRAGATFYW